MPVTPTPTITANNCRITFAVIGMVVGLSIFGSFGFYFRNWHCAVWGLVSGIFAALTLGIHIEYRQHEWRRKPNFLRVIMFFGCLAQFLAISAFIIYIALGIHYKQRVTPWNDGFYVTSIWCLMSWKWSFLLFLYSRSYWKLILSSAVGTDEHPTSEVAYQRI